MLVSRLGRCVADKQFPAHALGCAVLADNGVDDCGNHR